MFKKGDRMLLSNCRLISILPVINKLFEKLTLKRLNSFLEMNNLITDCQRGFRSGYSTDTASLSLLFDILCLLSFISHMPFEFFWI